MDTVSLIIYDKKTLIPAKIYNTRFHCNCVLCAFWTCEFLHCKNIVIQNTKKMKGCGKCLENWIKISGSANFDA